MLGIKMVLRSFRGHGDVMERAQTFDLFIKIKQLSAHDRVPKAM